MPQGGKARRVAARQAQLGQRKRRSAPRQPAVGELSQFPRVAQSEDGGQPPAGARRATSPRIPNTFQRSASSRQAGRQTGRQAEPRISVYNYVGPELRRIAVLTGVVVVVLIVLAIVLS